LTSKIECSKIKIRKGGKNQMDTNQIRQIIKKLNIVMRCPKCGKRYSLEEIFLKRSVGTTYWLQLNCSNCHTPIYATLAVNGNVAEMAQKQIAPEQTRQLEKPEQITPSQHLPTQIEKTSITNDDIIEMHRLLEKYQGDFSKLF